MYPAINHTESSVHFLRSGALPYLPMPPPRFSSCFFCSATRLLVCFFLSSLLYSSRFLCFPNSSSSIAQSLSNRSSLNWCKPLQLSQRSFSSSKSYIVVLDLPVASSDYSRALNCIVIPSIASSCAAIAVHPSFSSGLILLAC
jgi:hypothetical protein